jgi:ABC-2 type transport system ATP-binding protein
MGAMTKVLSAIHLSKKYRDVTAVDGISFDVGHKEIVGLLGPNGAGKTTTINMILGVLQPSAGAVLIEGLNIATNRSQALRNTNFAAVYENLRVFGMLYGVRNLRERIAALLEQFGIAPFQNVKSGLLSSGEQTRLSLAKAMLNRPHLLLLDEPTASLDPSAARDIREKILDFVARDTGGVLWTSHNMYEVEEVCDRVLFLSHGKILLEGNPKTLAREHGKKSLEELFITVAREPLAIGAG